MNEMAYISQMQLVWEDVCATLKLWLLRVELENLSLQVQQCIDIEWWTANIGADLWVRKMALGFMIGWFRRKINDNVSIIHLKYNIDEERKYTATDSILANGIESLKNYRLWEQ